MKTLILNEKQIEQKLKRIAFEIVEQNFEEEALYLIGIDGNGKLIAEHLAELLSKITDQKVETAVLKINKKKPLEDTIEISISGETFKNGTVILVDDVLNSGKTMQYALGELLKQPLKKIKTVALVDRKHRRYPIRCDYVGLTLSTTLQDRIDVVFSPQAKAFLV